MLEALTGMGKVMRLTSFAETAKLQTRALVKLNGCNSLETRRLEENLRRYAAGTDPIR